MLLDCSGRSSHCAVAVMQAPFWEACELHLAALVCHVLITASADNTLAATIIVGGAVRKRVIAATTLFQGSTHLTIESPS